MPAQHDSSSTTPVSTPGNTLAFSWVPIGDLRPYGRKARTHSRKQIGALAESIRTFGFSVPILVDDQNRILAGNGRLEAARSLGMINVPVVMLSHLDAAQKRAFVLAENRLAELAGWDRSVLQAELQELADLKLDFELDVIGFDDAEIETIVLGGVGEAEEARANAVPPTPQAAVTQAGDIWQLGDHRLICGDALDAATLVKVLEGEEAAAVFTDPPYNCRVQGHVTKAEHHREFAMASGEMSDIGFTQFLGKVWEQIECALRPGGLSYVCMDWRHMRHMLDALEDKHLEQLNMIVWDKTSGGMGSFYRSRHELIFFVKKIGAPHQNRVQLGKHGRDRANVWAYEGMSGAGGNKAQLRELHPTVKPVAMVRDALLDSTRKGDPVVDLFMGSGTTLLAAEMSGRKARGIEIDPCYCDVTIARWEAFTGREARLAATGRNFNEVRAERSLNVQAEGA
jgi:DNA modification methylase